MASTDNNVSEHCGNPYISSERINRDRLQGPLKFGLRRTSFNSHLSSQMQVRSPNVLINSASHRSNHDESPEVNVNRQAVDETGSGGGGNNVVFPIQSAENSMIKSVQLCSHKRPLSKGNFFNSNPTNTMYRSKEGGLTEARMDFSTGGSKLPQEVTYYQNIT